MRFNIFRRNSQQTANDPPVDDEVQMNDIPRLSTETQRRNGFRQSQAPDRSTRIVEDLRNGV